MKRKELLSKIGRRLARPVRLYALWQSSDPYLQLLGACAQAALKGALTAEERAWIQRLEALREELSVSTEKVVRLDFGAGLRASAEANEAQEQEQGTRVEDD